MPKQSSIGHGLNTSWDRDPRSGSLVCFVSDCSTRGRFTGLMGRLAKAIKEFGDGDIDEAVLHGPGMLKISYPTSTRKDTVREIISLAVAEVSPITV